MLKIYCLVTLLFFSIPCIVLSQEKQFLFSNLNKSNGLSHNHAQVFLKDRKGFMWIGTTEGLCRFDGYKFKVYKNDPLDSASLKDNIITNLFEDNNGKIWIASGDYLMIFDPVTDSFVSQQTILNGRIKVPIKSKWFAKYDNEGNIWYVNNYSGIYKYDVATDSVIRIKFNNNTTNRVISSMEIDKKSFLWISLNNATLYKINNRNFKISDSIELIKRFDNSYQLYCDKDNDLWIFDKNNASGLFYYNTTFQKLDNFTTKSKIVTLSSDAVSGIIQDNNNQLWISTDHGGINILNKQTSTIQLVSNNPFNERSLCENSITAMYKDYQGFIWVGSFKKGISYYHPHLFNFNLLKVKLNNPVALGYNDIDNFAEDKNGNLWIGTNGGGLIYFDRKNNTFKQYTTKDGLGSDIIIGLLVDRKNRVWAGTYFGGLNLFENGKFQVFKNIPKDTTSISDDRIWDICEDKNGKLWIATLLGGVNIFDPELKKVISHFHGLDKPIKTNVVFSIIEGKDNIMWFSSVDGLRSYDRKSKKFEYFMHDDNNPKSISKNFVYDVYEDSRGLVWAATTDGLNMYNPTTQEFKIFKQQDGLPSNFILTIVEDDNNNMWVSTSNGLSNIIISKNIESKENIFAIKSYDIADGLQGNEFNEKAAYKTRKGELIFGGPNGFNIFYPEDIQPYNLQSDIVFTDFQVFNKSINNKYLFNNRKIIEKSITYTPKIVLKYKENVFTVEFSSLNFFHPERRKYKYKLENFNKDWFTIGSDDRKVTYTNLNPGKYIFKVKATNNDGTWSDQETTLTIIILTPWWNSLLFKVLVTLLIGSVLFTIYYFRFYKLSEQKQLLERKVKERTRELTEANTLLEERQEEISIQNEELAFHRSQLEKIVDERTAAMEKALKRAEESDRLKSAFLANMSHEIRTPMNAIVGFAYLMKDETINNEERSEYIDIINKNCESLLVLINDILDISKIESNQLDLVKKAFNVLPIMTELEDFYNIQKKNDIEIKYVRNEKNPNLILNTDVVRFRQIFQNLLNNAIKFTENGYVHFGYEILPDKVKFYIVDTGIGIKEENFNQLFNSFNKIEDNNVKLYRGAGLGLSISKKMVDLLEGDIWLNSKPGEGTSFYFTIPYMPNLQTEQAQIVNKQMFENEINVLVAEDEPANFQLIDRILKNSKAKVIWAKNGLEAVEYVKNNPTDNLIVLMDIKMPVMDGIEALTKIKEFNHDIPIIAVTAYAFDSEKEVIMKNDFNGYMSKPIKPIDLVSAIEKNIGKSIR